MKIDPNVLNKRDVHELIMSAVVPRPIAWISSIGKDGIFNLAPYSAFSTLCLKPSIVSIQIGWKPNGQKKDTLINIEYSNDFVINIVNETLVSAMIKTSAAFPLNVDEFKEVGLTPKKADKVKSPMVKESPVNMECRLLQVMNFGNVPDGSCVVIAEVILIHIKKELWNGNYIDPSKLRAVGRIGERKDFCRTTDIFKLSRP